MAETPTTRRRSPQEKKQFSYERDCVNVYGENDKSSRKAIRRFKAASHREERRAATALVAKIAEASDDSRLDAALSDVTSALPARKKFPDVPLGLYFDERRLKRRAGTDDIPTHNRRESVKAVVRAGGRRRLPTTRAEFE